MKTGTNTVILFLERRNDRDHEDIIREINQFFISKNDVAVARLENAFSTFVSTVYDGLSLAEYLSIFTNEPTERTKTHELYLDYRKAYGEDIIDKATATEKEKLFWFLLTHDQEIVLVKAGKGREEKKFLGYEFSERRGHEGLHWLHGGTMLYDETDLLNPQRVNSYIYQAFLEKKFDIEPSLAKHVFCAQLCQFIEYGTSKFNKTINLGKQQKNFYQSRYHFAPLKKVCTIISGQSPEGQYYNDEGVGKPFYQGKTEFTQKYLGPPQKWTTSVTRLAEENDIVMSVRAPVGPVNMVQNQICIGRGLAALRCGTEILPTYLFHVLRSMETDIAGRSGMAFSSISQEEIAKIRVPLPPLDIQQKIVAEFEDIERNEAMCHKDMESLWKKLLNPEYFQFKDRRIGDISVMAKRGKSAKYGNSNIQIIKSGQARGYLEFDFSEKHFVADGFVLDERKLEKGDILINSTGVGTAGRVTLFDLYGDFVVDSHITIIRLDKSQALPKYVLYALANIGFKQIEAMADGQSGQIELPLDTILAIKVPLPPIGIQQKIVDEIQQYETQIAQQNVKLETLKAEKASILKKHL